MPPARSARRRRTPVLWMLPIAALIAVVGAAGVLRAADRRTADVERLPELEGVLADIPGDDVQYPAENFLLVGSDTRVGFDPDAGDAAVVGSQEDVAGRRSDTIMILRQERNGGASIMSIPRDLWVEIAGTGESQRINTAYNEGPERLAATVSGALGIPIHHYIEVDFQGFKNIVDEVGGIEICVDLAASPAATSSTARWRWRTHAAATTSSGTARTG
jgi:LCP family protein required for cell wall assembly